MTWALIAFRHRLYVPRLDYLAVSNGHWISLREWHPGLWASTPAMASWSADECEQKD